MPKIKKTLEQLKIELQNKKEIVDNLKTIEREADFLYKMARFFRIGDRQADKIKLKKLEYEIANLEQLIEQRETSDETQKETGFHFTMPLSRKERNEAKVAEIRAKYEHHSPRAAL